MPALPQIQRPESQYSEKRAYRLSLSDSAKNSNQGNTKKCTVDKQANTHADTRNVIFEDAWHGKQTTDDYFRDAIYTRSYSSCGPSPAPPPSMHPSYKHPLDGRPRGLPRWVSALGLWLPSKQKSFFYQSISSHIQPLERTKNNMLNPLPHLPRCGHARTLSALDRQRQKIRLEEEIRHQERFMRLLERFANITQSWEKFKSLSEAIGQEHRSRLDAFKKSKDHYKDPAEVIKQKRDERERIERERQEALEKARQEELERRRRMIPEIIITNFDEDMREQMAPMSESTESATGNVEGGADAENKMLLEKPATQEEIMTSYPIPEPVQEEEIADMEVEEQAQDEVNEQIAVHEQVVLDEAETEEAAEVNVQSSSTHLLAPPALSALETDDEMTLSNGGVPVDETVGMMAGKAPVALGMCSGLIPDSAVRCSSVQDRYHTAGQARLNNTRQGKKAGAWCPKKSDAKQYLQIDLGSNATVMQVATQGYPGDEHVTSKDMRWVKSYSLAYSSDGKKWTNYTEAGNVKVFDGNKDNNTVMLNSLADPVEARYIRFLPKTWRNNIAMRVEVYGNFTDTECPTPKEPASHSPEPEISDPSPSPLPSPSPVRDPTSPAPQKPLTPLMEGLEEEEERIEQFRCSPQRLTPLDVWVEEEVSDVVEMETEETSVCGLGIHPGKHLPKLRHKGKKTKTKKKKHKKKKAKLPLITGLMDVREELSDEEPGSPDGEDDEEEEKFRIPTPPLPELSKRPVPSSRSPSQGRRTSMFSNKSISPGPDEEERRKLARAQTNNSIRDELRRQEIAEERKKKLESLTGRTKRTTQQETSSNYSGIELDSESFLLKYCILNEGQTHYYRRIFENFDEDEDGYLFPEELLEALECVNKNLLNDSHLKYIFRALEMCDCSLDSGVDFKFFSVVAAFSQRIAALDKFAKILISKLNFRELDYKLQRAKSLFKCYASEDTHTMSMEHLTLELMMAGLNNTDKKQLLRTLGQTTYLDFLDFLTYIPLFIHIHEKVIAQPLRFVASTVYGR